MDRLKLEAGAPRDNSPSWADVVADTARPGTSFAELLSWVLDLAESSDQFSEWEYAELLGAIVEHVAPLTGDEVGCLAAVLNRLFTIAQRRAPAGRKAPGANVRREGRYRVATAFQPLRRAG